MRENPGAPLESEGGREEITFWIDTPAAEFTPVADAFVEDLARVLEISPGEIRLVGIADGCSKVTLEVPRDSYERVVEELLFDATSPQWLSFKQQWRIVYVYDARKRGKGPSVRVPVLVQAWPTGRTFTWLHLSDVHFKAGARSAVFMQSDTLSKLLEQMPKLLDYWRLQPDAVFVTGDVGHSGKPAEYDIALAFFSELRKKLPAPVPLLFIPGNHDADSSRVDPSADAALSRKLEGTKNAEEFQQVLAAHLLDDGAEAARAASFAPLAAFDEFCLRARPLGQPEQNQGYFYTTWLAANGVRLGIAGLNSAWRCASKIVSGARDHERLALGLAQIRTALEEARSGDADVTVALLHHPPDSLWYAYFDRFLHRTELRRFDFLLHGHEHFDHSVQIGFLDHEDAMVLAAGALYEAGGYPKTFKAVRFNLDSLLYQVYFWRYLHEKRAWLPDPGPAWPLGYVQAALGTRLRTRHAAAGAPRWVTSDRAVRRKPPQGPVH